MDANGQLEHVKDEIEQKQQPQEQEQQKVAMQIHELYAISLKAKNSRSLASSLYSRDSHHQNEQVDKEQKMSYSRRRLSSLWMPRELDDTDSRDHVNKKALQVLQRVSMKLRG